MAHILANIAALVILIECVLALNSMTRSTCHRVRASFLLLIVATAWSMLSPIYGGPTASWSDAITLGAFCLFMLVNKRRSYLIPPKQS